MAAWPLLPGVSMQAQGLPNIVWTRGGGSRTLWDALISGDGTMLVTTSTNTDAPSTGRQEVKVHRLADGMLLKTFLAYDQYLYHSALSPTENKLATFGLDSSGYYVKLWSIPDGTLLWQCAVANGNTFPRYPHYIAFSPDGQRLYAQVEVTDTGNPGIIDLTEFGVNTVNNPGDGEVWTAGQVLATYPFQINPGNYNPACISAAATAVAVAGPGVVLDPANLTVLSDWGFGVPSQLSPDASLIAGEIYVPSAYPDPLFLGLWGALVPGNGTATGPGFPDLGIAKLVWTDQDNVYGSVGTSILPPSVFHWNISSGTGEATWSSGGKSPQGFSVWPIGAPPSLLAVGGPVPANNQTGTQTFINVVHTSDGSPLTYTDSQGVSRVVFDFHGDSVMAVAFSSDGQMIATGSLDDDVKIWRVSDGALLATIPQGNPVLRVAFSPDGKQLAVTWGIQNTVGNAYSGPLNVWDISSLAAPALAYSVGANVWQAVYSSDGTKLATIEGGPGTYTVNLRRPSDGTILQNASMPDQYIGHKGYAGVALTPDNKSLAAFATDGYGSTSVAVYNVDALSSGPRAVQNPPSGFLVGEYLATSIAFSSDSKKVAIGAFAWNSPNGGVLTFDAANLNLLWYSVTVAGSPAPLGVVDAVTFDPCANYLVTACKYNGPTNILFLPTNQTGGGVGPKLRYDQEGGSGINQVSAVNGFAYSPDGQFYAYARYDNAVVVAKNPFWTPPKLASVACSSPVYGGNPLTGTVSLNCLAPIGNAVASLQSSDTTLASVPATVTIPVGVKSATFPITIYPVAYFQSVTLTASYTTTYNGKTTTTTKSKVLTINPPALSKLILSSTKVKGGTALKGTITLTGPTAVDTPVAVSSTNAAATPVDANGNPITSVTVAKGAKTATFNIATTTVTVNTTGYITASLTTTTATGDVTVTKQVALAVTP